MENSFTKLPPKKLAIIAVVGIGGGLAWKHFAAKRSGNGATTATDGTDLTQLALAGSSTGNLATGAGSGMTNVDTSTTREIGSINFPVVKWVINIGGVDWLTDGKDIWPMPGSTPTPTPKPTNPYGPTGPFVPEGDSVLIDGPSGPGTVFTDGTSQWTSEVDRLNQIPLN